MPIKTRQECWQAIVGALTELLEELGEEPDEIVPETKINADLGITSVDMIHLMILLEDRVGAQLDVQELVVDGDDYVTDLAAGQILEFVSRSLSLPEPA